MIPDQLQSNFYIFQLPFHTYFGVTSICFQPSPLAIIASLLASSLSSVVVSELLRHHFSSPSTYNDSFINTVFTKALSQYLVTLVGFSPLISEDFGTHFLCELKCQFHFLTLLLSSGILAWKPICSQMQALPCQFPQHNLEKTYPTEGKAARAIWKKAEVLFYQFCGKQMIIAVSFRPELQLLSWVSAPGSSEVCLERMNQR